MRQFTRKVFPLVLAAFLAAGCSSVSRHKVLSTIFDGVPSLPPPERLCRDYVVQLEAQKAEAASLQMGKLEKSASESRHEPYTEKRCSDCHDKNKDEGLIKPKLQLCFECHPNIVDGLYQHGPAAVGDCLSCHLPHTATFKPLLKLDRNAICSTCHREKRLTVTLHNSAQEKGLACADCHDPHAGNALFFVK
jgi:predicted CXXCH cytochrome family protein